MLATSATSTTQTARHKRLWRAVTRRGFNLLELSVVVAILAIVTTASITRFGYNAMGNGSAEGFARKLALSLTHARRATIATGDNHYIRLNSVSGNVASYDLIRRASGGDVQVDETRNLPDDVSLTSSSTTLEYDFDGSALLSYSIVVSGPDRNFNVIVDWLTGSVRVAEL